MILQRLEGRMQNKLKTPQKYKLVSGITIAFNDSYCEITDVKRTNVDQMDEVSQ